MEVHLPHGWIIASSIQTTRLTTSVNILTGSSEWECAVYGPWWSLPSQRGAAQGDGYRPISNTLVLILKQL